MGWVHGGVFLGICLILRGYLYRYGMGNLSRRVAHSTQCEDESVDVEPASTSVTYTVQPAGIESREAVNPWSAAIEPAIRGLAQSRQNSLPTKQRLAVPSCASPRIGVQGGC